MSALANASFWRLWNLTRRENPAPDLHANTCKAASDECCVGFTRAAVARCAHMRKYNERVRRVAALCEVEVAHVGYG